MNSKKEIQHVFIVGSKGIPAQYGGYETFVEKLTQYQKSSNIKYHVACAVDDISNSQIEFEHNGAHCFNIEWRKLGAARAIFYDIDAIKWSIEYIKKNKIDRPIIYVLTCRIGPFIGNLKKQIKEFGGTLYVNPDGHEWLRAKWSAPVRKYWKISERLMVKHSDLMICDSKNIEKYILKEYKRYKPNTTFIAYGSDTTPSTLANDDPKFQKWCNEKKLKIKKYYIVVGRFVPENNFEAMIREFMASNSKKDFAIISTANEAFLSELEKKLHFRNDRRIKFVGTVYDQELLKKIRENAYGYFHGHEVGGTNPSLLEAMGSTNLNLLLNVGFNREVGEDGAVYWDKSDGNLAKLIEKADEMSEADIAALGMKAKKRISDEYEWEHIVYLYEGVFLNGSI